MENQHRKITGYRELSQTEIDLMNRIKLHGEATKALVAETGAHLDKQFNDASLGDKDRLGEATPHRWLSIARTDLQTGYMALVRAVAQPTTF